MLGETNLQNVIVHNNMGNVVASDDVNLMATLQYSVTYLNVKDVIVCGNYDCPGIQTVMDSVATGSANDSGKDAGMLSSWLAHLGDVYRLHQAELNGISDTMQRSRRFVEINVIEKCFNVLKTNAVQSKRIRSGEIGPRIHAMVYDPPTGDLKRVPVSNSATQSICFSDSFLLVESHLTLSIYSLIFPSLERLQQYMDSKSR